MIRLAVVLAVVFAGVIGSAIVRRRSTPVPTRGPGHVPSQLDRDDFVRPEAPWLVALFTSSTCNACADVERKAFALESPEVAVAVAEYVARRDLHRRYAIDAVPAVAVCDAAGVVRWSHVGPVSATDLWAAVARVRGDASGDCSAN